MAFAIGLVIAFMGGELACRYLLPVNGVRYIYDIDTGTVLAPSQTMRWTNRLDYDNWVKTNSAGFHDVEHTVEKPHNTFRVAVLGDSFIEALQVPIEDGFCRQFQISLQGFFSDKQVEVINLALSGRGPAQYYRILEKKGLQYHPDLVVMAVLPANDFQDSSYDLNPAPYRPLYRITEKDEIELLPYSIPSAWSLRSLLQRSSMAYFLVYEILQRPFWRNIFTQRINLIPSTTPDEKLTASNGDTKIPWHLGLYIENSPPIWKEAYRITLRMIRETSDLAQKNGARFMVFVIPDKVMVESAERQEIAKYGEISIDYRKPFKVLNNYCENQQISFVDLTEAFRSDYNKKHISHSWPHDGHWNQRGHSIAAETVAEYIGSLSGPDAIIQTIKTNRQD